MQSLSEIDQIIRNRKTSKVLSSTPLEGGLDRDLLKEMIETAGTAPFHIAAATEHREGDQDSYSPWRFHIVDKAVCLALRQYLIDQEDHSKVPNMLAATDTLIQVTWCPDPVDPGFTLTERWEYCPSRNNMEHIAATAAAVQNLLLVATERGIASYWSSGGPLRSDSIFEKLGIPTNQVLLGSVFLFANVLQAEEVEIKPGKMRDKKGNIDSWARWVEKLHP